MMVPKIKTIFLVFGNRFVSAFQNQLKAMQENFVVYFFFLYPPWEMPGQVWVFYKLLIMISLLIMALIIEIHGIRPL